MIRVTVTDRDGWRKDLSLQKSIIYVGSDPSNDIVLEGSRGTGVAPRHAQLLSLANSGQGNRLVNLGTSDIVFGPVGRTIPPMSSAGLNEGELVKIGDFALVFTGLSGGGASPFTAAATVGTPTARGVAGVASGGAAFATGSRAPGPPQGDVTTAAASIGLRLSIPSDPLGLERPLEGAIVVKNQGARPGAQFKLQVEGIDPALYDIGPGPILFPNAEKEVVFRINHPRKSSPPAGECPIVVRASAPDAYPGEMASVSHVLTISPFFTHKLKLTSATAS